MANGISSSERDEAQAPYFAWKGRMSRWPLWFGIMGMILVDVVLFVICLIILLATNYGVYLAFVSAALVGNLLILSMFFVKRAHDRGHSGMYALLLIVPFVGVVILFEMLFFKGTRGPNRYGPDSTDIEAFERGSNSIDTSKGRMSRGRFWSVTSGIVVVDIIWLTVGVFFSGGYEGYILFSIFLFIAFNFNLVWFVMLFVKRAHDRDRSAAYVLLLLVPVIG
ncbi:MAG: DUF805 domain-containing protein, partial [SAR202 cluster bacterium]|nr:DUF805 domain-containing protein [SAR202 cluster bacterium]